MTCKLPFFLLFVLIACSVADRPSSANYSVHDYRTVKLFLDTLNAKMQRQVDSTGTFTVPYTELQHGVKRLIFFGTSHVRYVDHPQFRQLERAFQSLEPQIAFNEGGQIPDDRRYSSRDSAILLNGETGLLKLLCDSARIRMMNGDLEEKNEIAELRKKIPVDQLYLYMAIERFLNGYNAGHFPGLNLDEAWRQKFISYVQDAGLGLTREQESMDTLKAIYKRYLHRDFKLDSIVRVDEYYLTDDGVLGDVGRATKIVRDEALLSKIDQALDQYDRVFVVFGNSHRIAVEPALKQIMERKRD